MCAAHPNQVPGGYSFLELSRINKELADRGIALGDSLAPCKLPKQVGYIPAPRASEFGD